MLSALTCQTHRTCVCVCVCVLMFRKLQRLKSTNIIDYGYSGTRSEHIPVTVDRYFPLCLTHAMLTYSFLMWILDPPTAAIEHP